MSSLNQNRLILDTAVIKKDFSFKKENNQRFMYKQKSHKKATSAQKSRGRGH